MDTATGASSKRWSKIEELFHAALERPGAERGQFVADACADDAELRAEVERLLAAHTQALDFIEPPIDLLDEDGPYTDRNSSLEGQRIGRYQVKRIIASGGMGTVYEAIQDSPERPVAIKIMRGSPASCSTTRRFLHEATILGRLRHPQIAQIFEAGTFTEGDKSVPYFAMEYIPAAKSLTEYAKDRQLGLRERLELFATVCDAVAHGHQRGVIHRDLKPANILVDAAGCPKVIDFGVARVLDPDVTNATIETGGGQLIGTLSYVSPEQCTGNASEVDTRSDVYALGVVLYELLCDRLPYDLRDKAITEVVTIIHDAPPKRPSAVSHLLRGDLEKITLKSIAKDRELRYQSASEFAADIRSFLNNEPVRARPPSKAYQFRMFVRRYRAFVAAGAVVAVGLVVSAVVSTVFWSREVAQRERAEHVAALETQQRVRAETTKSYLTEILSAADPNLAKGNEVTVREILDRFAARLSTDLSGQPEVEAEMHTVIGTTYSSLGLLDSAEVHFRTARELYEQFDGESDQFADAQRELGGLLLTRGRMLEAENEFRSAVAVHEQIWGAEHPEVAQSLVGLGESLRTTSQYEEAIQHFRRAIAIFEQYPQSDDGSAANNLALLYDQRGETDKAEVLYQIAWKRTRDFYGPDHTAVASCLNNIAGLQFERGQYVRAEDLFREALATYRRILGDDHLLVANVLNNIGVALRTGGKLEEAGQMFRESLAIHRKALGEKHPVVATGLHNTGTVLVDLGAYDEALPVLQQAIELRRELLPPDHPDIAASLTTIARIHIANGELLQAEAQQREALGIFKKAYPTGHPSVYSTLASHGELLLQQSKFVEAEAALRESLDGWTKSRPMRRQETVRTRRMLGLALMNQDRLEEAELALRAAHAEASGKLSDRPEIAGSVADVLVQLYEQWGKEAEADRYRVAGSRSANGVLPTDNRNRD